MKLLLLTLASLFAVNSALTSGQYEAIRQAFFNQIKKNYKQIDIATVLRLSFHDCVGGCDGCLNLDNPSNAGLQLAIDIMEDVLQDAEDEGIEISRADLWAIGGRAAAEYGMTGMPGHEDWSDEQDWQTAVTTFVSPFITFRYGREDCPTAPYTSDENHFPDAQYNHDDVFDFFADEFGFNKAQAVTIMGAHTLGRCALDNSGYHGPWVLQDGRSTFDKSYYSNLINPESVFYGVNFAPGETGDDARPMYRCKNVNTGKNCGNMLNADLALAYKFEVDEETRFIEDCDVSGSSPTCPETNVFSLIQEYAADNDLWMENYIKVYDRMTANGYDSLTKISQ